MSDLKKFEAERLIGRCQEICERILRAQGDAAEREIVQLQHDCVEWKKIFSGGKGILDYEK